MRFLPRSLLSMRFLLGAAATIAGWRAWRGLSRRRATQAHPAAAVAADRAESRGHAGPANWPSTTDGGRPPSAGLVLRLLRWLMARKVLLGVATGIGVPGAVGLVIGAWIIYGGIYDTAASYPHFRLVAWGAHTTMIHSVRRRSQDVEAPGQFTQDQVLSGAKEYEEHCIACHGGAAVARAPWASAMLPSPPFVIDAARHWSRQDLYIIVQQGVKMSAMPAWGEILPQQQIWDIVAFLEAMPDLSPADYAKMRAQVRAQPTTPLGASGPTASLSPQPLQDTEPFSRTVASDREAAP